MSLRIALVHPFSWPKTRRGGERYLHDLGWYLARAGHEVTIVTGRGREDDTPAELIDGVPVERAWDRPGRLVRRLPQQAQHRQQVTRIARALRGRSFDVVHAFWPPAAEAASRVGFATVYTLLGMPTAASAQATPGLHAGIARAAARATVAGGLSTPATEEARRLFPGRWVVLPPGVRLDRFPLEATPRQGPPRWLFSASLGTRYKGLPHLLQAFARLVPDHPDATLVLSGTGDHRWALDELDPADRERVASRLQLPGTGGLEEADARYRDATVTVLPSTNEAFGLSVVESLACGTPVVVCDDGGPAEIVGDAAVGATVPWADPAALAQALVTVDALGRQPDAPRRCRARAERWGWQERLGAHHEALYAAIAAGRPEDAPSAA